MNRFCIELRSSAELRQGLPCHAATLAKGTSGPVISLMKEYIFTSALRAGLFNHSGHYKATVIRRYRYQPLVLYNGLRVHARLAITRSRNSQKCCINGICNAACPGFHLPYHESSLRLLGEQCKYVIYEYSAKAYSSSHYIVHFPPLHTLLKLHQR